MKRLLIILVCTVSFMVNAQFEADKNVTLTKAQQDDIYLAGETVTIKSKIEGDLVVAGRKVILRDSIAQDLLAAGGDIMVEGHVNDDIRAAGGTLTIDSMVNDDVVISGGEVLITEQAIIKGNLICFSGHIVLNGDVLGLVKIFGGELQVNGKVGKDAELYAGEIVIDGRIAGATKMVAETIVIGSNALFYGDVEYWCESGKVDFKGALQDEASAVFNEELAEKQNEFPYEFFGTAAVGVWTFYLFSAFLVILLCNWLFKTTLSNAAQLLDKNISKSIGYGLIYLFGLPIVIGLLFIMLIGIPIGLFLTPIYIFSLVIGHLVLALLLTYYLEKRNENTWGFWASSFLALGIAIALRIVTLIPFLGFIISIAIITLAYGLIGVTLLHKKQGPKKILVT